MPPIKIVIADDHTFFRDGLKWILSFEQNVEVVGEASRGDEVVKVVESAKPDVLLLDLKMPRGEPAKTVQELSEKNPATKVLVLTAFSDEETILKMARAGARGYVLKGTDSTTLIQAIKRVHAGGVWVDREIPAADAFEKIVRSNVVPLRRRLEAEPEPESATPLSAYVPRAAKM